MSKRLINEADIHNSLEQYFNRIIKMTRGEKKVTTLKAIQLDCKGLIESCPTVNAVEVIRCQNCRLWEQHTAVDSEGTLVYLASGDCGTRETNKDDYCSFAVRRESNETD